MAMELLGVRKGRMRREEKERQGGDIGPKHQNSPDPQTAGSGCPTGGPRHACEVSAAALCAMVISAPGRRFF